MTYRVHICQFSSLDDLKKKDYRNPGKVLAALKAAGRFSCFEVQDSAALAKTVTMLFKTGRVKSVGGEYPWTNVEVPPLCGDLGVGVFLLPE